MAFATAEDVATRLGRTLSAQETATVEQLLQGATAAVAGAAGRTDAWAETLDPVPETLKSVTVEVVHRVIVNPDGASSVSEQLGSYQYTRGFRNDSQDVGLALTEDEKRRVRRAVSGSSFRAVTLETPYSGTVDPVTDLLT